MKFHLFASEQTMRGAKDSVVDGYQVREAFGRLFVFHAELLFWYNPVGRHIQVHQGKADPRDWYVVVPDTHEFVQISGMEAEDRAFSTAVGYITQAK